MRKDIEQPKVEHVGVAIVPEVNVAGSTEWNVYLINLLNNGIEGVLVSSKGYGEIGGKKKETSQLRHSLGAIQKKSVAKVEPIMEDLFGLTNQYWVSYFLNEKMYDKKFVFVAGSITNENLTLVPIINKKGILIL